MTTASYVVQFLFDYLLNLQKIDSQRFFSLKFKRCQLYGTKKLIEADVLEMKVKWDNKTRQQQYLFEQNGHHSNFVKEYFLLQYKTAREDCNIFRLQLRLPNRHTVLQQCKHTFDDGISKQNQSDKFNLEKCNATLTLDCFAPTF